MEFTKNVPEQPSDILEAEALMKGHSIESLFCIQGIVQIYLSGELLLRIDQTRVNLTSVAEPARQL